MKKIRIIARWRGYNSLVVAVPDDFEASEAAINEIAESLDWPDVTSDVNIEQEWWPVPVDTRVDVDLTKGEGEGEDDE